MSERLLYDEKAMMKSYWIKFVYFEITYKYNVLMPYLASEFFLNPNWAQFAFEINCLLNYGEV